MKTISKIIAVLAILALAFVPISIATESSDAEIVFAENPTITGQFGDMGDGKVLVTINNNSTSAVKVTIQAVEYGNESRIFTTKELDVPAKDGEVLGVASAELVWHIDNAGTTTVKIIATPDDGSEPISNVIQVNVSHSIWKDPVTYVVIVVIIIAIAIAVFIKLRSNESKKKEKNLEQKSFTQMREEKLAGKAVEKPVAKKTASVEKKTYEASTERKKRKQ